jgi:hypothetical protein
MNGLLCPHDVPGVGCRQRDHGNFRYTVYRNAYGRITNGIITDGQLVLAGCQYAIDCIFNVMVPVILVAPGFAIGSVGIVGDRTGTIGVFGFQANTEWFNFARQGLGELIRPISIGLPG